jgi:hypothetical protein
MVGLSSGEFPPSTASISAFEQQNKAISAVVAETAAIIV